MTKTSDLPPLFVTGLRSIDALLIRARSGKARNRFERAQGLAYMRAVVLNDIAIATAGELALRDDRIKELEAEVAKLTELAGGEETVKENAELKEDVEEAHENISKLEEQVRNYEDRNEDWTKLAEGLKQFLGTEKLDEPIELYDIRRLLDDVLG